jgi:hypothetical protein
VCTCKWLQWTEFARRDSQEQGLLVRRIPLREEDLICINRNHLIRWGSRKMSCRHFLKPHGPMFPSERAATGPGMSLLRSVKCMSSRALVEAA